MAKQYALARLIASNPEAEPVTEINIIPVIDISLVLLVIMFVSAPMLSFPNLNVELPKSSAPQTRDEMVVITYTLKGELALGSAVIRWPELDPALRRAVTHLPDAPVVLRVDKGVPYRIVERLIASAKGAGAKKIALGTDVYK